METPPKLLPHVLLAVLTVLVFGAIALSLVTAPPVAQTQLRSAAQSTLDATGFRLVDTNAVTALGTTPSRRTSVIDVLYEAPDRVRESGLAASGQPTTAVVAGSSRLVNTGQGWTELPTQAGLGAEAAKTVLAPLQVVTTATDVSVRGDVYRFLPGDLTGFITTILGAPPSKLSGLEVSAVVRNGFVTEEDVSAVLGADRLSVALVFSAVGSAPPVTLPTPSAVSGGAGG